MDLTRISYENGPEGPVEKGSAPGRGAQPLL